jgi:hypothetical protein
LLLLQRLVLIHEALLELPHLLNWVDLDLAVAVDDSPFLFVFLLLRLLSFLQGRKICFKGRLSKEIRGYLKLWLEGNIDVNPLAA